MNDKFEHGVLALVPIQMQPYLKQLEIVVRGALRRVTSVEELMDVCAEGTFSVVLIPVVSTSEQWWSIWGCLNNLEPRPSIIVYALRSDFVMWSSVLEAGGYDLLVAPFTAEKLRSAIEAAAAEFARSKGN